ncbi:midnolin-like [Pholidichthys leucotaenia]
MEQQQQQQQRGPCAGQTFMRVSVTSTTGSPVELTVPGGETVEGLRTRISQKVNLQTDRIALLHKDRRLTSGKLLDHGVTDGSRLTLVPVIEAGLCSAARADRTIMDVLESLSEVQCFLSVLQINGFLSGYSPLTINLGLGAHTMYVQLQLSAQDVEELRQEKNSNCPRSSEINTHSASELNSTPITGSTTSPALKTSPPALNSPDTPSYQLNSQRPRTCFKSAGLAPHPSSNVHNALSVQPHASPRLVSSPSLPSCPLQGTTPVCSRGPTSSTSGPPSPRPASTFTESNVDGTSPADHSKQPGAVIQSFVKHSPGVFSGTFSGTLAPCSHSSISHPRHGISIILQILNDLLSAAYHHQGTSAVLPRHACPASVSPLLTAEEPSRTRTRPAGTKKTENPVRAAVDENLRLRSSTEENQTLHCKLEHLQLLMHQKRLRRRTRKRSHLPQNSHPY